MPRMVITGTQVYGPAREDSDIDIVLYVADAEELENKLYSMKVDVERTELQEKLDYRGYYFNLGPLRFNIVVLEDEEGMNAWEKSTKMMRERDPIEDRDSRINFFEALMEKNLR